MRTSNIHPKKLVPRLQQRLVIRLGGLREDVVIERVLREPWAGKDDNPQSRERDES